MHLQHTHTADSCGATARSTARSPFHAMLMGVGVVVCAPAAVLALGTPEPATSPVPVSEVRYTLPRFSAAIAMPGQSGAVVSAASGGSIDVPESARAGVENRAYEDALQAHEEAERMLALDSRPTVVNSATVMRAGDRRFSITVFRNLFPFRRYGANPVVAPNQFNTPGVPSQPGTPSVPAKPVMQSVPSAAPMLPAPPMAPGTPGPVPVPGPDIRSAPKGM